MIAARPLMTASYLVFPGSPVRDLRDVVVDEVFNESRKKKEERGKKSLGWELKDTGVGFLKVWCPA